MLTQRTFGPVSTAETKLDLTHMKDGDVAGLIALQKEFGYIGVKQSEGRRSLVYSRAQDETLREIVDLPENETVVYLRIECDFRDRADIARFYYRLDDQPWVGTTENLRMRYTLPHFMGYRFGLFNYATRTVGGHVDFDYYRIGEELINLTVKEGNQ